MKTQVAGLPHLLVVLTILGFPVPDLCGGPEGSLQRYEFEEIHMGTVVRLVLFAPAWEDAAAASVEAFDRVEELEQILSDYRDESELSRVQEAACQRPVILSQELYAVLERSLYYSRVSGGAFDITVKPLVELWREAESEKRLPTEEELAERLQRVGYEKVLLNPRTRSLRLRACGMKLDLGGIGKGYVADELLRLLEERGLQHVMIDAGGDLVLGAPPPETAGWEVQLEDLLGSIETLFLSRIAVATSGDLYRYIEIGGQRYSHILDPFLGYGLTAPESVTVLAREGAAADALATALSVLEVGEGMAIIESLEGVEARVARSFDGVIQVSNSSGFPP